MKMHFQTRVLLSNLSIHGHDKADSDEDDENDEDNDGVVNDVFQFVNFRVYLFSFFFFLFPYEISENWMWTLEKIQPYPVQPNFRPVELEGNFMSRNTSESAKRPDSQIIENDFY